MMFFQRITQQSGEAGNEQLQNRISQIGSQMKIVSASGDTVYIQNTGNADLDKVTLNFYADGTLKTIVSGTDSVAPAQIGEYKLNAFSILQTEKLKVTTTGTEATLNRAIRKSCKEILDNDESSGSSVYKIKPVDNFIDVYCDMTTDGGGWTRILTLVDLGSKTNNALNNGIMFTMARAVKATDPAVYRQATFSISQAANQNLNAVAIEANTRFMLVGPGGYGVYTAGSFGGCNWGNDMVMVGAGFDGSGCGDESSLRTGKTIGTTPVLTERFNVDIFVK